MKIKILFFCVLFSNTTFGQFKDKTELKSVTNEILDLIQKHSIVTDSINWTDFKIEIDNEINRIPNVDSSTYVFYKIFNNLHKYGDYHSFYLNKTKANNILSRQDSILLPSTELLENKIGYIKLPAHMSINESENYLYADTLRIQIKKLDVNNNIKGWIVDLRENKGGNMWPMLAGLNPLIEDNTVGYFVSNKSLSKWKSDSKRPQEVPKMKNNYKCKNLKNKIAILIDTLTASSGEMTTISLLGMVNSKSFGNQTAGYTTANGTYKLSNGAYLFLANSYCEDRNKKKYIGKIQPDVKINNTDVIKTAIKWLEEE